MTKKEKIQRTIVANIINRMDKCSCCDGSKFPKSPYCIENGKVYMSTIDENNLLRLIAMPMKKFITEFKDWLEMEI